ncbi:DUF924 domain-containing protein [Malikia spinosa]|uniref:DUF924 domain-containing protein n=1 Tax=Malikia spinosa TaxID=86180 RepID=A0A2S9KA07_9BURK|nr:DUF924 family protein [Malikia spinosa]PRD67299.1 DUF924 domain-containing protein [Malikia spinosa]
MYTAVLNFWFREIEPRQWWAVDPEFDTRIRDRFLPLLEQAASGELSGWRQTPEGRLAEVIVLDQFSRNIFRNTPRAFLQDPMALVLAQEAVASGALAQLDSTERAFLLMPYMHSESIIMHAEAEQLFKKWTPQSNYNFELRHKAIIDRFGRYPHRNKILGRVSTPEEEGFLKQPGSRF